MKEIIEKMKCPKCMRLDKTSTVFGGYGSTTLAYYTPFYDEDGKSHHHDGNTQTTSYNCSNGHNWTEESHGHCWCGWSGGNITITYQDDT